MTRDEYERRRKQLVSLATKAPDPGTRATASADLEKLRAVYRRTRA